AIPRPVKGDEGAALVGFRKFIALVDLEVVWRPMGRIGCNRWDHARADADLVAAVAAILRREHQLLAGAIIVAGRPAIGGTLLDQHHFLGRQLRTLLGGVEPGPVLMQLVTAMLGGIEAAGGVEIEPLGIAQAAGIALLG